MALNLKQLRLELWRVCSFNYSETVASHALDDGAGHMWGTTSFGMDFLYDFWLNWLFAVASHV